MIFFYLAAYISCIFFALTESTNNTRGLYTRYLSIFIIFILLFLSIIIKPIGLGYDDLNYLSVLEIQNTNAVEKNPFGWERAFMVLIYFSAYFEQYQFYILGVTVFFICYFFNTYTFNKLSPIITISILWYLSHLFFYKELTQYRSAIAYSIVFFSFYLLFCSKIKSFIILILLASLFHYSALIALIAIIAKKLSINKLMVILILSVVISSFGILNTFLIYISSQILNESAFNAYVLDKLGFASSLGILNPTTIKYLFFSVFFYITRNKYTDYSTFNFTLSLYILAPIWILIFNDFGTLAGRPASIFSIFEGVLLSHFAHNNKNNYIIPNRVIVIILSISLFLINILLVKPINTVYI